MNSLLNPLYWTDSQCQCSHVTGSHMEGKIIRQEISPCLGSLVPVTSSDGYIMFILLCQAGLRSVSGRHSFVAILKSQESLADWKRAEAKGAGPPRRRDRNQKKSQAPPHVLVLVSYFALIHTIYLPLFLL